MPTVLITGANRGIGLALSRLAPSESAAGLKSVMDGLSPEDSGRFFDYKGRELPW